MGDARVPSGCLPCIGDAADRPKRTISLGDDPSHLRYVSGTRAEALERMGLRSVRDVLLEIPHRYQDFSHRIDIAHADVGREATVVGTVDRVTLKRPKPHMSVVELAVVDATGVIMAVFFKQPWIAEQVKKGDVIALSGSVSFSYGFKKMTSPYHEVLSSGSDVASFSRILPVHRLSEGLSAAWMRRIESCALAVHGDVCDYLPASLVARRGLMTLARALREAHFPSDSDSAERARRRLAYDELLCLQVALLARRHISQRGISPTCHEVAGTHVAALRQAMPFELSDEQDVAVREIFSDRASGEVMNRLLLGDVGTGKTAVAAFALAAVADTGTQAAMMAPTSVLARQYAEKLGPLLERADVRWAVLVGSTPADERARSTAALAAGDIDVVFGTTALLSGDVRFRRLSLVVIDEQHRFGVDQRAALRRKGPGADLLAMSATPIPRTLALSVYGDMSLSRIAHRPVAGAGVATEVLAPENLDIAYGAIRDAVGVGQRAYVVCPLIDDADDGDDMSDDAAPEGAHGSRRPAHSATSVARELEVSLLRGLRIGLLTGRMPAAEKDRVMERFRAGDIDVLVSTTVIEVGVDVPEATVMLVHDADRFGLATLHQLRGRVGRGSHAGRVFLGTTARKGTPARRRLSALERTSDGMELAQKDLELRHEGEVLGYRQSGGVTLRHVDLVADDDLVRAAHHDAHAIASADPDLVSAPYVPLAFEIRRRFGGYFEEMERS